jgi:uncharacterized protein YdeI (YjbR/CyaY-like superfamily)
MPEQRETSIEKVPKDLLQALTAQDSTELAWKNLTPIGRRDFISWIDGAKQPATRKRRITITCSKLKAGERRPCCFSIVPMNLYKAIAAAPEVKTAWKKLTPEAKRDLVDWVHKAKDSEANKTRIQRVCLELVTKRKKI